MSHARSRSRTALLALGGTLAVSFLVSTATAQRPPPTQLRQPPPPAVEGRTLGHGKGWLSLPEVRHDGRMEGVLVESDGDALFRLEAFLTGCIPAVPGGSYEYQFGGFYGNVFEIAGETDVAADRPVYVLEGTWALDEPYHGSFSAIAVQVMDTGRRFLAGKVYGEFEVSAETRYGLGLAPVKVFKTPAAQAIDRPEPLAGDVASAPRKGELKTPAGLASENPARTFEPDVATPWSKGIFKTPAAQVIDRPEPLAGDVASAPRKGELKTPAGRADENPARTFEPDVATPHGKGTLKTPAGQAASQPRHLTGNFMLRFVFVQ